MIWGRGGGQKRPKSKAGMAFGAPGDHVGTQFGSSNFECPFSDTCWAVFDDSFIIFNTSLA